MRAARARIVHPRAAALPGPWRLFAPLVHAQPNADAQPPQASDVAQPTPPEQQVGEFRGPSGAGVSAQKILMQALPFSNRSD